MQRIIKQWLMFGLAVGVFASCSQEGNEPHSQAEVGGETVNFSLSAEVSVDEPNLRAIDYKLGKNSNGDLVPMPQFRNGQEVEVHTILKSSNGAVAAKTLKWRYDATKKKLTLGPNDGHSITVSGFNNDNGVKWYVSGLIGGTLIDGTTRVTFAGERVLKGVDGNEGDIVGSLNVPYAFGWTELTINTSEPRDSEGSHKYALVPTTANVKFVPRGSLIAYKLGNAQTSGNYTFTPKGFSVSSNLWGDQGEFELSTDIPDTGSEKVLPFWVPNDCVESMYYTFADGHSPGEIAHDGTADKTYYAWVSSYRWPPAETEVRVMLQGTSSRPETETYKDYTKTYFTDYAPKEVGNRGQVTEGKVHKLTARATRRVALPIEYVADYNLAGGEGWAFNEVNSARVRGPLRFASSHNNDQSNFYTAENSHNPGRQSLQTEVDRVWGAGKYFLPSQHHFDGVFMQNKHFSDPNPTYDEEEIVRVGVGRDILRKRYRSDYSKGFILTGGFETNVYAIRFKAAENCNGVWSAYQGATDNSMRCAYRFRALGSVTYNPRTRPTTIRPPYEDLDKYATATSNNLTNRVAIDVVYLGEEGTEDLSTISSDAWWSTKQSEGKVISRVFPAVGSVDDYSVSNRLGGNQTKNVYIAYLNEPFQRFWNDMSSTTGMDYLSVALVGSRAVDLENPNKRYYNAYPVRLWKQVD